MINQLITCNNIFIVCNNQLKNQKHTETWINLSEGSLVHSTGSFVSKLEFILSASVHVQSTFHSLLNKHTFDIKQAEQKHSRFSSTGSNIKSCPNLVAMSSFYGGKFHVRTSACPGNQVEYALERQNKALRFLAEGILYINIFIYLIYTLLCISHSSIFFPIGVTPCCVDGNCNFILQMDSEIPNNDNFSAFYCQKEDLSSWIHHLYSLAQ